MGNTYKNLQYSYEQYEPFYGASYSKAGINLEPDKLVYLTEFLGGEVNVGGDYPAWEYKADSDIRDTISAVYKELFNEEPVFEAIHAGLECGILSGKIENLDCVSFGPNNYDIHTPKERLSISSTEKVWKLLVEFLKRCK